MEKQPFAQLESATKTFGNTIALNQVSFAIESGQVLALLGPNGAGKTTAIRLLLGLAKPTAGRAKLFGRNPQEIEARRRVGVMLQTGGVPATLRVREHLELFSSYYPNPRALEDTVAVAGLRGLEHRFFGELSGGQKQRLLFALAICGRPDLLFLDEPTVGLDPESRRGLWRQVQSVVAEGAAVLLTTHYIEEVEVLASRVLFLRRGTVIADGTPEELKALASAGTLEDAFLALTKDNTTEVWA